MTEEKLPGYIKFAVQIAITLVILAASFFLVFYTLRAFFWSFLIAILLYASLDSQNKRLRTYIKNKDLATIILLLAIVIVIVFPSIVFSVLLIQQILDFIHLLQENIENKGLFYFLLHFDFLVRFFTEDPFFWVKILEKIYTISMEYKSYLSQLNFPTLVGGAYNIILIGVELILSIILYLLFGFLILYFLFRDGDKLYSMLLRFIPFEAKLIEELKNQIKITMSSILLGNLFIAILQGFFLGLGFLVAGIPNVILYGFLASIVSVIPVIGTSPVWLPGSLYLYLAKQNLLAAAGLGIYAHSMYLILENIVKPKILDKRIGIPSIVLFFAILGGIKEFGAMGIILGPLILSIFIILWRTFSQIYSSTLQQKN